MTSPQRIASVVLLHFTLTIDADAADAPRAQQEWQAVAVKKYPALGEKDSQFNKDFLAEVASRRAKEPGFFLKPDWPMVIADRVAAALAVDARQAAVADKKASSSAGYRDGYLVGKADACGGRARDGAKAMRLGKIHAADFNGDKAAFAAGYHLGYNEAWHARRKQMGF